ncbi:MAG: hypothetical protein VYD08_11080, partial [Pseudomonadota bacterium]|nr:hypothetical protein [Pseudomonadota bacterium]
QTGVGGLMTRVKARRNIHRSAADAWRTHRISAMCVDAARGTSNRGRCMGYVSNLTYSHP